MASGGIARTLLALLSSAGRSSLKARSRQILIVLAVVVAAAGAFSVGAPAASAADTLPDLRMARLRDFTIQNSGGRRLLRYTTIIVNVPGSGVGRFEVFAQRPNSDADEMTTKQRIYTDTGSSYLIDTPATGHWGGDGHSHWHIKDIQASYLTPIGGSTTVAAWAKQGFCFYDNWRYRYGYSRYYFGCGSFGDLSVTMGLAVGWGDKYGYSLPGQYIDITNVQPGNYRLWVVADQNNWFREKNNDNNYTWADLYLAPPGQSSRILGYGPSA
jgi:hypothetical protein